MARESDVIRGQNLKVSYIYIYLTIVKMSFRFIFTISLQGNFFLNLGTDFFY